MSTLSPELNNAISKINARLRYPILNMPITIGADPELFIYDSNGDLLIPEKFTDGTKERPSYNLVGTCGISADGFAFELTPGCVDFRSSLYLFRRIEYTKNKLKGYLERTLDRKVVISTDCYAEIPENLLLKAPDKTVEFGCDPDFSMEGNLNTINVGDPRKVFYRTAGGHIHIGFVPKGYPFLKEGESPSSCLPLMRDCIMFASVFNYLNTYYGKEIERLLPEDEVKRKRLYGAGCPFRPKKYGLELRMFSNKWMFEQNLFIYYTKIIGITCAILTEFNYVIHNKKSVREAYDRFSIRDLNNGSLKLLYNIQESMSNKYVYKEGVR